MIHGRARDRRKPPQAAARAAPAKKSLGQCFLVETGYAAQIVDALNLASGDTVLEIGPGRGVLSHELVRKPCQVVAVEIDNRLIAPLAAQFASHANFELRHEDFLDTDFAAVLKSGDQNKVVGNLPYHLAAEVLYKLMVHVRRARTDPSLPWIDCAVLMMQREVADRVTARPGTKAWGKLSVFAQLEANCYPVLTVPASAFRPEPQVDGGVIRLDFLRIPPALPYDMPLLERIVRWCFHQRRKMLKSTLSELAGVHPHWQKCELDFTRRPETLTPQEWVRLSDVVSAAAAR
ncbi:ribosomal RNA small subunit methyltransferase A [candidate division KSB1 bacterium]|nr:ribosomal RNA small subunit methyltransferase A [candidate division KSB1 bacterium]